MEFIPYNLYHFYNRGNNNENIFYSKENYYFFLDKIKTHVLPFAEIFCWCLMPNHFHIMLFTKDFLKPNDLNDSIAVMLRSYTRAINKSYERTGSLFQQKSKAKLITNYNRKPSDEVYDLICFHYIHQNPMIANLVQKMEDWEFSSFLDYIGQRLDSIVNKKLAYEIMNIPVENDFYKESYNLVDPQKIKNIF
jgi:putative transposase